MFIFIFIYRSVLGLKCKVGYFCVWSEYVFVKCSEKFEKFFCLVDIVGLGVVENLVVLGCFNWEDEFFLNVMFMVL